MFFYTFEFAPNLFRKLRYMFYYWLPYSSLPSSEWKADCFPELGSKTSKGKQGHGVMLCMRQKTGKEDECGLTGVTTNPGKRIMIGNEWIEKKECRINFYTVIYNLSKINKMNKFSIPFECTVKS